MRIASVFLMLLIVGGMLLAGPAHAQVPAQLSYQGLLTTPQGQPITDGAYRVTFRLYADADDGQPTEALFEETQTVAVAGGLFSTLIGKEALLDLPFDQAYFLTVEVEGQPESEKVPLATSPYALNVADGAVVRSISGLKDDVEIVAGEGIAIEQRDNQLVISAPVGLRAAGGAAVALATCAGDPGCTLHQAYLNGPTITVGGPPAVQILGTGNNIVLRVQDGQILQTANGANAAMRFQVTGGAVGTQTWQFRNILNTGQFQIQNTTDGQTPFQVEKSAMADLMKLFGNTVFVNQPTTTGNASLFSENANNLDGIHGRTDNMDGHGVFGEHQASQGSTAYGVYGETGSDNSAAVKGLNLSEKGNNPYGELGGLMDLGVFLGGNQYEQYGAYGQNRREGTWDLHGVLARSQPQASPQGGGLVHDLDGVYGTVECQEDASLKCHAVHGKVLNFTGVGEKAGFFEGDVQVIGTLSKSAGAFKIDHPLDPENKYLLHSFVESPDMMNVYNGNTRLDAQGEAWIELPEYFDALNSDYRYQLTAIGAPGPNLYVAEEIRGNRFKVAGGQAGMKVSWQVTGVRQDAWAKAHRIPAEEWKEGQARGRYLNPRELGKPIEMGIYAEPPGAEAAREARQRQIEATETARARGDYRND